MRQQLGSAETTRLGAGELAGRWGNAANEGHGCTGLISRQQAARRPHHRRPRCRLLRLPRGPPWPVVALHGLPAPTRAGAAPVSAQRSRRLSMHMQCARTTAITPPCFMHAVSGSVGHAATSLPTGSPFTAAPHLEAVPSQRSHGAHTFMSFPRHPRCSQRRAERRKSSVPFPPRPPAARWPPDGAASALPPAAAAGRRPRPAAAGWACACSAAAAGWATGAGVGAGAGAGGAAGGCGLGSGWLSRTSICVHRGWVSEGRSGRIVAGLARQATAPAECTASHHRQHQGPAPPRSPRSG